MAYVKQNFTDGEILRADQLAKMEEAILENEKNINGITETDPTVPAWAKAATKPSYTAEEVGADASGTAAGAVAAHNVDPDAHNDIRLLIGGLTTRLNALANSDDVTLDQMAEVVAFIKDNRGLIEQITTGKVSVSDIVDNLTTNVSNKPLSAAQGVALKLLTDTNASDIVTLQRVVNAVALLAEENSDAIYKITPRVNGETLIFGGTSA